MGHREQNEYNTGVSMLKSNVPTRVLGVVPARFASTRFPGKSLATLAGKPILQHVFERAQQSRYLTRLVIATDDARIADAAHSFRAPVYMTRADHPSGTDRVAEVASGLDFDVIVNIQGDEPLIDPSAIDIAIMTLVSDEECAMGSLKKRIENPAELSNPNIVKVVTDRYERAVYFSRSPIPYVREAEDAQDTVHYKHIGLYVYRKKFLLGYSDLPIGPLERAERLEQLRALENGHAIRMAETEYESIGIDTPQDLADVSALLGAFSSSSSSNG